jgi:hypothetical protein
MDNEMMQDLESVHFFLASAGWPSRAAAIKRAIDTLRAAQKPVDMVPLAEYEESVRDAKKLADFYSFACLMQYVSRLAPPSPEPAKVAGATCIGKAVFPRTGGNVGISWYVDTNGADVCGSPRPGENIYVLTASGEVGK